MTDSADSLFEKLHAQREETRRHDATVEALARTAGKLSAAQDARNASIDLELDLHGRLCALNEEARIAWYEASQNWVWDAPDRISRQGDGAAIWYDRAMDIYTFNLRLIFGTGLYGITEIATTHTLDSFASGSCRGARKPWLLPGKSSPPWPVDDRHHVTMLLAMEYFANRFPLIWL